VAPRDQRVADNGIVSFFCKASGNPAPEVYWRKGGRRVATGRQRYSTLNMPHGSVLRIEPVKASRDDDDSVECVADNGIGEAASAAARLDIYPEGQGEFVTSPPHAVTIPTPTEWRQDLSLSLQIITLRYITILIRRALSRANISPKSL